MEPDVIESLHETIKQAEQRIKRGEHLDRLRRNPDFIALFREYYLKEYAAYWALALGSRAYAYADPKECNDRIVGIGQFHEFMVLIDKLADHGHQDIAACRHEIDDYERRIAEDEEGV